MPLKGELEEWYASMLDTVMDCIGRKGGRSRRLLAKVYDWVFMRMDAHAGVHLRTWDNKSCFPWMICTSYGRTSKYVFIHQLVVGWWAIIVQVCFLTLAMYFYIYS